MGWSKKGDFMNEYVEVSCYLPFFDLLDSPYLPHVEVYEEEGQESDFAELVRRFCTTLDVEELYARYMAYGNNVESVGRGDVFVFHKRDDRESFLLLDLFHDFTDQHNMVRLGIRCTVQHYEGLREVLLRIYDSVEIKSRLLEGNGELKRELTEYPKHIKYGDRVYVQELYYDTFGDF